MNRKAPETSCANGAQPGRLRYIGAIVLGLDDALVEFTGALAGFTVALGDTRTIALAGITTGVAATLSMAASEFLSQETAANGKDPWTAAFATGLAYLLTVALLLLPYFLFAKPYLSLGVSLFFAGAIILCFTWLVARLKRIDFRCYFLRMFTISFSIAFIAFLISWFARVLWGIEV